MPTKDGDGFQTVAKKTWRRDQGQNFHTRPRTDRWVSVFGTKEPKSGWRPSLGLLRKGPVACASPDCTKNIIDTDVDSRSWGDTVLQSRRESHPECLIKYLESELWTRYPPDGEH